MLLLLDILTTAAILFVVSVGLLAIFGVLKIINFAHGAWLTIGAYCAVVAVKLGLNPWAGLPIAFIAGARSTSPRTASRTSVPPVTACTR